MDRRAPWLQAIDAQVEQYVYLSRKGGHFERRDRKGETMDYAEQRHLLEVETAKLRIAEPVFVTAEMCALVEAAAPAWNPEPLRESDLLTPSGFLLFEEPVEFLTGDPGDQVQTPVGALAWAALKERATAGSPYALNLSLYMDLEKLDRTEPVRAGTPRLSLVLMTDAWFNHEPASDGGIYQLAGATLRLLREFRAASRYSTRERPDRPARRATRRAGLPEHDVLVVRLRREQALADRLGAAADYAYRWMVSGHWRNQWFPSTHEHRQVWIAPYVKGPEDKPFRPPRRRVFNFYR